MSELFTRVADLTQQFRAGLDERAVGAEATVEELRAALGGPLPEHATDDDKVIEDLAASAARGLIASAGPRYFGFVIGGSHPAALAADWLTSGWDNNSGLHACAPAISVIEEAAGRWVLDLLQLPPDASVGFTTGAMMANFSGLAAARHHVLAAAGWDVEAEGLQGAPPVRVLVGAERHATIDMALRYLGLGAARVDVVDADGQGRMRAERLAEALGKGERGPTIVCAQAGNVNTGACDPFPEIVDSARAAGAWVHVDGAFGLWAAATEERRELVAGVEGADSWATDAHKWLNVPYDCGIVCCRHPEDHRGAHAAQASYLVQGGTAQPYDAFEWVPEFSRRGRGVSVYAVIRALGRDGIATMISRGCSLAQRFAERLDRADGVQVLNDVVLNQVLVRFGDSDERTRAVVDGVQQEGTCWMSGTVWQGVAAMRISVSNWSTTEEDVDASVDAILRVLRGS
jgi:glutamate/tyrosine decarboxylase-like PLP-dependent enzyme